MPTILESGLVSEPTQPRGQHQNDDVTLTAVMLKLSGANPTILTTCSRTFGEVIPELESLRIPARVDIVRTRRCATRRETALKPIRVTVRGNALVRVQSTTTNLSSRSALLRRPPAACLYSRCSTSRDTSSRGA